MSTKIKPNVKRFVGNVDLRSVVGKNEKGRYIATATMNGKQFHGEGNSERLATMALRQQVDKAAAENQIPER